jgi:hypothetical protein
LATAVSQPRYSGGDKHWQKKMEPEIDKEEALEIPQKKVLKKKSESLIRSEAQNYSKKLAKRGVVSASVITSIHFLLIFLFECEGLFKSHPSIYEGKQLLTFSRSEN